ncbi:hypothetical protein [Streptomyces cyaneofuscatus]|uniref:hypothetical protein n=1 Tax=Streptomyces cyaneofuscatus TaxID=66883 RepID=UPI003829D5C5
MKSQGHRRDSALEGEYGPVTDADLAAAEAERREIEQWFADQAADRAPAGAERRNAAAA